MNLDGEDLRLVIAGAGVAFGAACLVVSVVKRRAEEKALRGAVAQSEAHRREVMRLDVENARLEDELREFRRRQVVAANGGAREEMNAVGDRRLPSAIAMDLELLKLRKKLDAAQGSEQRQRAVFDGALDGMAVLDRESLRFVDVNPSLVRMTGFDAGELFAKTLTDLFCHGPGRPGRLELQRAGREGRALMVEITRKDGRGVFVEVSAAVVGAGQDARVLAVIRDVSERRLLEQELQLHISAQNERERRLEDANRELALRNERIEGMNARLEDLQRKKDDFVSTVSHELRTPLTSIRSFSEILLDYGDAEESVRREFLGIIHKECKRLTRLVDDVLDLARIEADASRLDLTEFDAKDVVDDAVKSMAGTAKARGAFVRVESAATALPLLADRDKIQQLVMNLLGNGLKFGRQGGEVLVQVKPAAGAGRIEIAVSDDGAGLSTSELERVFEKFRRGRDGQQSSGTGLGLTISREIVKLHGGRIWAENRAEGGGCFRVELPAVQDRAGSASKAPAVETESHATKTDVVPVVTPMTTAPQVIANDDRWSETGTLPPLKAPATVVVEKPTQTVRLPPIR